MIKDMTHEKLLSLNEDEFNHSALQSFFEHRGVSNLTKKEMDEVVKKFGNRAFRIVGFNEIYSLVSSKATNKTNKSLTVLNLILTSLAVACAIIAASPVISQWLQSLK